jgi:long-chain acyl-CoA synthetase
MTTTIASRIKDRAAAAPQAVALRHKHLGIWQEYTWSDYWRTVEDVAQALLALGVRPGERVAIHSDNRPEWLYVDVAAVAVRATTVGLYATDSAAEVEHVLADSGARVHIVGDQEQLDKVLESGRNLAELEHIIYLDARGIRGTYDDPRLIDWASFLALGGTHRAGHPHAVEERMAAATPQDVTTLVYTSGTDQPSKGAMLTVANVEYAVQAVAGNRGLLAPRPSPRDLTLSYLPLADVTERLWTTWSSAAAGIQIHFPESVDTVPQALREVQPTILPGVPHVWSKLLGEARMRLDSATRAKRLYGSFWLRQADRVGETLIRRGGRHTAGSWMRHRLGWLLFHRAFLSRLGLREVRYAASRGGPLPPEVLRSYLGLGVPLHEVYGCTESTGIATANRPGRLAPGTGGEPLEGIEVRIEPATGEVWTRHPAVTAGYWGDPDATATAIDPQGWLHTGDVGEWHEGHLRILGRLQDAIALASGTRVFPEPIEHALAASPYVRDAVVVGDGARHLTALISIDSDAVAHWARRRGIGVTTHSDLIDSPEVSGLIQAVVDDVNRAGNPDEQIKDFHMLPTELTYEDGTLSGLRKPRRSAVLTRFAHLIEAMPGEPVA